ncbi:hypothetical protein ACO0LF_16660 [Undibacterium sp. Di27W]|uniref:hypothetical protein n=1 Tax=Undibacterium sp. Di27W TaxID=3413036 RepID=UPI003BF0B833
MSQHMKTACMATSLLSLALSSACATEQVIVKPTAPLQITSKASVASTQLPDVKISSTSDVAQSNVPVTFGQVFAAGDVPAGAGLLGQFSNGAGLPLQVDIKARHADGSVRHAIITTVLPQLSKSAPATLQLKLSPLATPAGQVAKPADLLNAGFSGSVNITIAGRLFTASIDQALRGSGIRNWLSGPQVSEWMVTAPLYDSTGLIHPHLHARIAVRSYTGFSKARVDVTLENDWAYQPAPQNFTYDADVVIGGQTVFSQANLTHFHHTRWRKTFWWGVAPQTHIAHNQAYLIASKAVPNYDQRIVIAETALNNMKNLMTGVKFQPMGPGLAEPGMPTTGGRPDIGLMPGWNAAYLLSMDKRAKDVALATADLAGSWSAHYRDKNTDKPISLHDYPYMTILGNPGDTYNPATKQREAFPVCGGSCTNVNIADAAHTPAFSYLPYLVTGDYYHLEEMQFWAMWDVFQTNPGYRANIQGLIFQSNVRVQAWDIRNLAEVAYITPDEDVLKAEFNRILSNNLDYYNTTYSNNAAANIFGAITGPGAIVYNSNIGIAPWMDDFFTSAVGRAAELGFDKAKPLLNWKASFAINRMLAPDYCWIFGGIYSLNLRATATSPLYTSYGQAYEASRNPAVAGMACNSPEMAKALGLKVGEMTGYSSIATGYPSNMQPALAYAADSAYAGGAAAWHKFMQRSVLPDYTTYPEFAILPRNVTTP